MSRSRPPFPAHLAINAAPSGVGHDRAILAERFAMMAEANGLALTQIDPRVLEFALAAVADAEQRLDVQTQRVAYLESLSVTDELTQVRNRRGFRGELERALAESARTRKGGVVLLIDLDGFKSINDTYGHAAGDFVLKTVATWLDGHVRPGDTVARLGGDEFAVLMQGTGHENGVARAAELDRQLNRLAAPWAGRQLKIRGSVGVAAYEAGDTADAVLARADETMYEKKRTRSARPLRLVN